MGHGLTTDLDEQAIFRKVASKSISLRKSLPGQEWLKGRGVEPACASACGVRYSSDCRGDGIALLFPAFDQSSSNVVAVAAYARLLSPGVPFEWSTIGDDASALFATPYAFAMPSDEPLGIVGDPLSAVALAACGIQAICLYGPSHRPAWLPSRVKGANLVMALGEDGGDEVDFEAMDWLDARRFRRLTFDNYPNAAAALHHMPAALLAMCREMRRRVHVSHHAILLDLSGIDEGDSSEPVEPDQPVTAVLGTLTRVAASVGAADAFSYAIQTLGEYQEPEAPPTPSAPSDEPESIYCECESEFHPYRNMAHLDTCCGVCCMCIGKLHKPNCKKHRRPPPGEVWIPPHLRVAPPEETP